MLHNRENGWPLRSKSFRTETADLLAKRKPPTNITCLKPRIDSGSSRGYWSSISSSERCTANLIIMIKMIHLAMTYQVGMPTCKIPNISRAHTEIAQCCPSHSAIKMTQPSVNTRLQNKEHQEGKHTALIANHENGNENCPFSVVKGDIVRCETRSVLVGRFGLIRVIKKDGQAWMEFQYW